MPHATGSNLELVIRRLVLTWWDLESVVFQTDDSPLLSTALVQRGTTNRGGGAWSENTFL